MRTEQILIELERWAAVIGTPPRAKEAAADFYAASNTVAIAITQHRQLPWYDFIAGVRALDRQTMQNALRQLQRGQE